jgi:hypothetical protein
MRPRLTIRAPAALLLAPATLALTCARPPEQPEPHALAGCHFFVQDDVAIELQLPWGVRLLDEPLQGWPAIQQRGHVHRATTLTGQDEEAFPFGYWIRTAHDSLEIGYPAGGGLLLELALENGAFRGTARPLGDAVPPPGIIPEPTAYPVQLTWARCPED